MNKILGVEIVNCVRSFDAETWWDIMQQVAEVYTVCFTGWNWCVDGVLYWLELVCRRCVVLVGTGV